MHLKRIAAPRSWPVERKGTKYLALPRGSLEHSLPLVIALRDVLEIARNKKEIKKALHAGNILVNNKKVRDVRYPLRLFDVLTVVPGDIKYKVELGKKGKFKIEESKDKSNEKISKILNKNILKGKKIQINLSDGRNYISDLKCKVGDSVIVNFEKNKIEKVIPFEEHKEAIILIGKNSGERGKILKIDTEKNKIRFHLQEQDKEIEITKKSIMVLK